MSAPPPPPRVLAAAGLALALAAAAGEAANWPHWRGPRRDGSSPETGLPQSWDGDRNIAWKLLLPGLSGSTPVVFGDRIYLTVTEGEKIELWCVARADGTPLWKRLLDDRNQPKRKGNLSSPSPVADASGVWALTGTGVVRAFDRDGRERWHHDLQQEYGPFGILHGYASSPLLHGGSLYVQVLHGFYHDDPSYLVAFDPASGEVRWRVERPSDAPREAPDAYTTPAVLEGEGGAVLVVSGADYVTGHDPSRGTELWRVAGLNPTANPMQRIVASPVVAGDTILVPSRVRPLLALRSTDPRKVPEALWATDRGPDVPTPAVDGERVYLLADNGVVWARDLASGEVVWGPERVSASTYSASPVVADGKLYVTDEAGVTTVLAAGPRYAVLARNELGEYTLSSLAISEGHLYLRTEKHLWAIGPDPSDAQRSAEGP